MPRLVGHRSASEHGWQWLVSEDEHGHRRPRPWLIVPLLAATAAIVFSVGVAVRDAGDTLAAPLSGAIFTTTPNGSIVNENVRYDSKKEVYLDGGPGPNAPQTAAGLPDGDYVFQVTDPPGKVLLSEDASKCRVFRVSSGVIVALRDKTNGSFADHTSNDPCHVNDSPDGAAGATGKHDTNTDVDHGPPAIVVQLMPFFDTPNPGGVYKAWAIPISRYLENGGNLEANPVPQCARNGRPASNCNGGAVKIGYQRDPGFGPPRDQVKTDNFKVKEFFPPEIKVRKFHDTNGDGVWDPDGADNVRGTRDDEPEIGVDQCVNSNGDIIPCPGGWPYDFTEPVDGGTVTNTFYTPNTHVAGIPGTYTACEFRLPGWTQSAAYLDGVRRNADQCVSVPVAGTSGEKHEIIFGNFRPATKSGIKFHDRNANGSMDAGEPVLSGWTINLNGTDGKGNPVSRSTATGADGRYSFSVPPGAYTVSEVCPAGQHWRQSKPGPITSEANCGANTYPVTLLSGEVDDNNDFGNFQPATKSGIKFHDKDADGVKDGDEPGLSGWTINISGTSPCGAPSPSSSLTDANGRYTFTLCPGTYTVSEVCPAGQHWRQSKPGPITSEANCGANTYPITLSSGDVDDDNDFGNFKNARKSGMKFLDRNGDHQKDGDPGLSGWQICIASTDGQNNLVSECKTTDANGNYSFTVPPGTYTVCETPQAGFVQTFPVTGAACANGTIGWSVVLRSGDDDRDNDFGNRPNEGCTPGYWKNHPEAWPPTGFSTGQTVASVFSRAGSSPYANLGSQTLMQALAFQGGETIEGAAEILLRASVSAALNAAHPGVNYPRTVGDIVADVNSALNSQDRSTILNLASQLDRDNNGPGGCPLN